MTMAEKPMIESLSPLLHVGTPYHGIATTGGPVEWPSSGR
jgi:hypothetical protein